MFSAIDLRALAEKRGPERAFLSLYLSGPDALRTLDHRIEKVRQVLAGNPVEQEHFEENLARVQRFLDDHTFDSTALCIFSCWADDFFKAYPLEESVRDRLWVGASPYVRPLAELQDEYQNFAVVAADNKDTRIYLVTSSEPEQEARIKGDIKNHVKVGGWSQKRYQRRREEDLHDYAQDVVQALGNLKEEIVFNRIVLLGAQEAMHEIEEALPEHMAEHMVGRATVDLDEDDQMWQEAFDLYFEEERADERELWERIKGEYLRDGLAVAGPEDVLEAAAVGRVAEMIVTRDAKIAGTKCRACENVHAGEMDECPACGSEDVFTIDLVNEIVELLATSGARTEFSDPIEGLSEWGDVAALLRYQE